ncbi:MAG TPA: metallophosphoesterase [Saprospiraceae bacterium]|nr:metallophosphoesterase [Saprospiraceae bacterium]HMQ84042.1 metallophosphoesterase [Saprospiraceae bacterium]
MRQFAGLLVFSVFMSACAKKPEIADYLHIGHAYDWHFTDRMDRRLEKLNFKSYDQIWLGGDVCARTSEKQATMQYLDSLLNFSKVHWSLGNHDNDYGELTNITNYLQRPTFYTQWQAGFCLMVLNTNLFWPYPGVPPQDDCEQKAEQLAMIQAVCDTIQAASHLVILHHHALFTEKMLDEKGDTIRTFNVNPVPFMASCDSSLTVTDFMYPRLVELEQKGIHVVLIGGDFGMRSKQFEYTSAEGITLLGSGVNNTVSREYAPEYVTDFSADYILELQYNFLEQQLSWQFKPLGELQSF